jgi:hypothetical protein
MLRQSAFLLAAALTLATAQPVIPYDSLMDERASVDGVIDNEEGPEYPGKYVDKVSGLTANWGFDDSLLYVGLTTKGRGWLAIGFGAPTMSGSNIIIGYYTDDSTDVMNQTGTGHKHVATPQSDSAIREAEIDFDEETGVTTMEFIYPLKFPTGEGLAVPGLAPGGTYDFILAQNTKTPALTAKHTNYNALKLKLAEKPKAAAAPKAPEQPKAEPQPPSEPAGH